MENLLLWPHSFEFYWTLHKILFCFEWICLDSATYHYGRLTKVYLFHCLDLPLPLTGCHNRSKWDLDTFYFCEIKYLLWKNMPMIYISSWLTKACLTNSGCDKLRIWQIQYRYDHFRFWLISNLTGIFIGSHIIGLLLWYSNQLINKFLQAIWLFVPTYSRINIKVRTNWFCILFSILFRYYFSFLFYLSARYAVRKIISPSKFHSLSIWRRNGILMRISDIRLQFLFSFPFEIKERHLLELITTFLRYCRQSENRSLIFNNCVFFDDSRRRWRDFYIIIFFSVHNSH